ncbi:hypothetical protein AKJ08_0521 [Vulgatibacter incomptus]|uniref:DUF4351 domain-containing protein n=2 Tax=Vulgatibacter incomptus TaxID=1391653 RepID=A0A0K1PAJ4_9BACT|nr:hypothetical protein AKJ08_0521 [Vulgatibacter incomptus]
MVLLFRNRPSLAAELAKLTLDLAIPVGDARVEEADLTQVTPTERRADLVVAHGSELRIVVEVQLQKNPRKRFTWPEYVTTLRSRTECSVLLLVVTPLREVAAWAQEPIRLGPPDFMFRPVVVGPDSIVAIAKDGPIRDVPELAVLTAIAQAECGGGAEGSLTALATLGSLDPERSTIYADLILRVLGEAGRKALEELMSTGNYDYQSEFARKYIALGEARGEARGRAAAILKVFLVRGLAVSAEQRARILSNGDPSTLESWLDRAFEVDAVDQLFK